MNKNIYNKLTPSARSVLNDMVSKHESMLIDKAYEIATEHETNYVEISLRDLVEAQKRLFVTENLLQLRRKSRLATTSLIGGSSYIILGIIMYFTSNHIGFVSFNKEWFSDHVWMIVIILGLFLIFVPIIYNLRHEEQKLISDRENDFRIFHSSNIIVYMWGLIEQKGIELMRLENIDDETNVYYFLERILSSENRFAMREIMDIRNKIVHSQIEIDKEESERLINMSQDIINELEEKISAYRKNNNKLKTKYKKDDNWKNIL